MVLHNLTYWLAEQPAIVSFRWSPMRFGSTWYFVFTAISFYILAAIALDVLLFLFRCRRPLPLGPIPALHSLAVALISAVIFVGMLLSAAAEIRDTRWFWSRTKISTPFHWLLCFPLGTRPSGRVFFWSYIFYLSRFLHLLRTFFTILRRRRLTFFRLFNQAINILMSFLWLEFSQSFQVLAILLDTLLYSVVYGYRFWTAIGLPRARFPFVVNCQAVLVACNLVCNFGVLLLHYTKGGCNGIGAWSFNSVLSGAISLLFLKFYAKKMHWRNSKVSEDEGSTTHRGSANLQGKDT